LIFEYMCGLSIYSSKGKKILWVSLCMLFSLSLSLQTPLIENPITPNTAVIKRQRKSSVLSQLPSFFIDCFHWVSCSKGKGERQQCCMVSKQKRQKISKMQSRTRKGNGIDSESRVNPREKVCIRSRRHAQDKTVAAYSRLRYCEASTRLQKA